MSKKIKNKIYIFIIVAIIISLISLVIFFHNHKSILPNQSTDNYNPQNSTQNAGSSQSGGIIDNNPGSPTNTSNQETSITLLTPKPNDTIGEGTNVSGSAGVTIVQYRIKDNDKGVIASGQLNVVNGFFSGTIKGIRPSNASGYFEIFDYSTATGSEENNIRIPVGFRS